ncbi:NADH dehydrogenase [ubiquinone] 1 alpha subcomplex subunit 13-like [Mercenaria mercenaria]|uniref:NADH dehydrogenase [ubiquinone] 1 alpha subcomplex subunit 13-like n=1 Tax=Mercenaria mercenaria TaxID=6596 RepID=UPI00234F1281|nr:NADH dehydrogenase [ubiquinone] 1 alpha subcomplex subunit 13-like [Mercenaria mercenaria]
MATYRQDRAPPGGYKDIDWTRVTRKRVSGVKILGGILAMKAVGFTWLYFVQKKQRLEWVEEYDSRVALVPFITAESDRLNLKQFMNMRAEEKDIMKDIPNWDLGKWKGEKVYHNEQNMFDAMMQNERSLHEDKVSFRERIRTWRGLNPI